MVGEGAVRRGVQERDELGDLVVVGVEPHVERVGRKDHRHPVMDPVHVVTGRGGDDAARADAGRVRVAFGSRHHSAMPAKASGVPSVRVK